MINYLKSIERNWSETISFQGVKTTYDFNIWTDLWLEITSIMIREKLPIIFSCFLISFVTGESGWNSFENILETRQIPGRLDKDQRWLSKQFVVSKMECLDICLRTTRCASFYLKQRIKNWICIILDKTPWESDKLVRQNTGWMNFNASSQKLQEVGSHNIRHCITKLLASSIFWRVIRACYLIKNFFDRNFSSNRRHWDGS